MHSFTIIFPLIWLFLLFLMLSRKNILIAYSSGVGASGVAAALSYAALTDVGFTPKTTLLLMLVVPLIQFVAFLFIRETSATNSSSSDSSSTAPLIDESASATEDRPLTLSEKWKYLPKLMKYFIPLMINCLCEYVVNQMVSSIPFHIKRTRNYAEFQSLFF